MALSSPAVTEVVDWSIAPDENSGASAKDPLQNFYYCIGTFGCLDNLLVILILVKKRRSFLQKNAYRFILHQSLVDMLAAVFLVFTTAFQDMDNIPGGLAGEIHCRLWLSKLFLWGPFMVSSYNLCAMTLERYIAVWRPITYKSASKSAIFITSVAVAWTCGIVFNLGMKLPTSYVENGRCFVLAKWVNAEARLAVGVLTMVLEYFVPLVILVYCYTHIILILRQNQKSLKARPAGDASSQQDQGSSTQSRARKTIIKTMLWVSILFLVCWTWNQIYFLLFNLGYPLSRSGTFYHFTVVAAFLNCTVNPLVYLVKDPNFRMAAKEVFLCSVSPRVGPSSQMSAADTKEASP